MTASDSEEAHKTSLDLINDKVRITPQCTLSDYDCVRMPIHHGVRRGGLNKRSEAVLREAYELQPASYEELVSLKGIGAQALRALALTASLVYGSRVSWKDPAKYSFAHGGKDSHPYPVNRKLYDSTIQRMRESLELTEIGRKEKMLALKRLSSFV